MTIRRAAGEFALIVAGVLTALAVDGWASARRERSLEREYVERLQSDATANIAVLEASAAFYRHVQRHANVALEFLHGSPTDADPRMMLVWLYHASRGDQPRIIDATYQELVATGGLRLIRDVQVRTLVTTYHVETRNLIEGLAAWGDRTAYRNRLRRLIPARVQATIATGCRLSEEPRDSCIERIDSALAAAAMARVRSDLELPMDLEMWVAGLGSVIAGAAREADRSRETVARLAAADR